MSRMAILYDMVRARAATSATVTAARVRVPPDHQPPAEILGHVVGGQLGAREPPSDGRAEVDDQPVGGLTRLWKRFRLRDSANAHIDFLKVRDVDPGVGVLQRN